MNSLDYYLSLPYSVSVTPESCTDGSACFMARVVELPGCESHGDSPEQALLHLKEAKKLFIASMLEDGIAPDPPHTPDLPRNEGCVAVWRMTRTRPVTSAPTWLTITLPTTADVTTATL